LFGRRRLASESEVVGLSRSVQIKAEAGGSVAKRLPLLIAETGGLWHRAGAAPRLRIRRERAAGFHEPGSAGQRARVIRFRSAFALIAPPDGSPVAHSFDEGATVADAIAFVRARLSQDFGIQLSGSNLSFLEPGLLLKTLPEPRNLTVREISRRGWDDAEKLEAGWKAGVGELAEQFPDSQFANRAGVILLARSEVRDANWHLLMVSKTVVRALEVERPDGNSRSVEVDSEGLIGAFLPECAGWLGVAECELSDEGGALGPEVALGSVRGKLPCCARRVGGHSDENPDVTDGPSDMFQSHNREFRPQIPTDWAALQATELIAIRYQTIADYISLVSYS
jgi:hypothetical protein